MMSKTKIGFLIAGSIVALLILAFGLGLGQLRWKAFFKPRHENVERKVFEGTKSYTHGMAQELAKHYGEYQKSDPQEKKIIGNIIKNRFADFDETKIRTQALRSFLTKVRGY